MNKTCPLRFLTPISQEIIPIILKSWSVSNLAVISLGCVTAQSAAAVVNAASCAHASLLFLILTKSWNGSLGWEMRSTGSFSIFIQGVFLKVKFFRTIENLRNALEEEESSDEEDASEEEDDGDERRDELELSLVDLTPQLASLFTNFN